MPRRRHVFKRGDVYYFRQMINGRNHTRSLGTSDLATARRKARKLEQDRDLLLVDRRETVGKLAKEWLETMVARKRKNARDRRTVAQRVRDYLEPFLGTKPIATVTSRDLLSYAAWLKTNYSLSRLTQTHILAEARSFFNWAVVAGYLKSSPVPKDTFVPTIKKRTPDRLIDEEVKRVLDIPEPWAFVIRLGLGTGMRWGEMAAAKRRDLQSTADGGWALEIPTTKNGMPRRVPLPLELAREMRLRDKLIPFGPSSSGSFNKAVRRHSGIERFHVHQLRHTFACKYMESSGSLLALQQILGHSHVETTILYSAPGEEMVRRDAAGVHARLAGI